MIGPQISVIFELKILLTFFSNRNFSRTALIPMFYPILLSFYALRNLIAWDSQCVGWYFLLYFEHEIAVSRRTTALFNQYILRLTVQTKCAVCRRLNCDHNVITATRKSFNSRINLLKKNFSPATIFRKYTIFVYSARLLRPAGGNKARAREFCVTIT